MGALIGEEYTTPLGQQCYNGQEKVPEKMTAYMGMNSPHKTRIRHNNRSVSMDYDNVPQSTDGKSTDDSRYYMSRHSRNKFTSRVDKFMKDYPKKEWDALLDLPQKTTATLKQAKMNKKTNTGLSKFNTGLREQHEANLQAFLLDCKVEMAQQRKFFDEQCNELKKKNLTKM